MNAGDSAMVTSFITDSSEVGSVTIRLEIGEIKGELAQKYNDTDSYNVMSMAPFIQETKDYITSCFTLKT